MLLLGNLPPHPVYALQTIPKPSVSRKGNSYITARGVNEAVTMAAAPPNFSWVEPKKLAGLAYPCTKGHYQFLFDSGIQHLVSLCESLPPHHDSRPGLQVHHIGIVDFTPPSYEQIKKFLSIVEEANSKDQGVGVHCMHGHGRTGTMLACYLVERKKISGDEAIKEIRRIRPGSIETNDQEKAVRDFHQNIQRG